MTNPFCVAAAAYMSQRRRKRGDDSCRDDLADDAAHLDDVVELFRVADEEFDRSE